MDGASSCLIYNYIMKFVRCLVLAVTFFLFACQPITHPTVTILDKDKAITFQTDERVLSVLITQAGLTLNTNDRVLFNGLSIALDQAITDTPITLQIRRAVNTTLVIPEGQKQIQSSALTVGEALAEASYQLHAGDKIDPPLNSPLKDGKTITVTTARGFTVSVDGKVVQIQSSARTVGEALAEAGIPLLGLDQAIPSENEALPADGQIKIVRVSESVVLAQKPIPFENELVASADIPLDQNQILQPGESGLSVQRIRIRYEDGNEVSRMTENETMVRPPKNRFLGYGTKVEIKTATVDGVQIEYWRAVQMYATSYLPCPNGPTAPCGSTTSSGKPLKKGIIAFRLDWYRAWRGQSLFVAGYGYGTVEDVCPGCVGKPWIDLGYSDADYQPWSSWVTVYFLTPVPSNVVYVLE